MNKGVLWWEPGRPRPRW